MLSFHEPPDVGPGLDERYDEWCQTMLSRGYSVMALARATGTGRSDVIGGARRHRRRSGRRDGDDGGGRG